MKTNLEDKQRVLAAAERGEDWKNVALALGVNYKTAWGWEDQARQNGSWAASPSARGGFRYERVSLPMQAYLLERIDDNCHMTLAELADTLLAEFGVGVSPQTVKVIDGRGYTMMKPHQESEYMNTSENKVKRREYVLSLMQFQSQGKKIFYVDETNYNIWCSRGVGRSKKGTRARKIVTASKGPNMHVIECISDDGLAYWERHFGSFTAAACQEWMRRLLRHLQASFSLSDVVIVLDNAPCHQRVESVFGEEEFWEANVLRLGPYSLMLNSIENVFSTLKAEIKSFLAMRRRAILRTPPGITIKDHRSCFLTQAADILGDEVVTEALCRNCAAHIVRFHGSAVILENMHVGKYVFKYQASLCIS